MVTRRKKSNGRSGQFTKKGERLIQKLKKRNKNVPKSKQVNPFAIATHQGFRRKRRR